MSNIEWQSPIWMILLCMVLAAGFSALVYFRSYKFNDQPFFIRTLLPVLRFLGVWGIFLLLLNPLIRTIQNNEIQPLLVLAQDVSASMQRDSQNVREALQKIMDSDIPDLYEVKTYQFGESVRPGLSDSLQDQSTNLSDLMMTIAQQFHGRNLSSTILLSDGIYNQGEDPVYRLNKLSTPVYSLAYGDTSRFKDLSIRNIFSNETAYQGDRFEVQIDVKADNLQGQSSRIVLQQVSPEGKIQIQQGVSIDKDKFFKTYRFDIPAEKSGLHHYRVSLDNVRGDNNPSNNRKDFYVDVIDASTKILLLARAPHPDVAMFSRIVENNKNYEMEVVYADRLKEVNSQAYDLLILHDLPSRQTASIQFVEELNNAKTPCLFVLSDKTDINAFNKLQHVLKVEPRSGQSNFVTAIPNEAFQLFTNDNFVDFNWKGSPPVKTIFGEFTAKPGASILLHQRIGQVETQYPLIVLSDRPFKQGVLAGSDWWKLRMFDYIQTGKQENIDGLFSKIFQYLALNEDKRPFKVKSRKKLYNSNESIRLDGSLLNANFELINAPEVEVKIDNERKESFEYLMDRTEKAYILEPGSLPAGQYIFNANTNFGGKNYKAEGKFSVKDLQLENFDLRARHDVLLSMTQETGGKNYNKDQVDSLITHLSQSNSSKAILVEQTSISKLIDQKWLLFFTALFFFLEWALRKYFGRY